MTLQIFPPESRKRFSEDSRVEQRHIFRLLDREFQKRPAVGIYGLDDWINGHIALAMHVDSVEGLYFKPEEIPIPLLAKMIDTHKTFVVCTETGKFQFTGKNLKIDENANIICDLPTEVYHIQRRDSFRVVPPVDESFKLIVGLGAGQELLTNIVDIGRSGVQLDMRAGATDVSVGNYWHTCYFERTSSRTANFDLQIKHYYQGNDLGRVRVGCELYQPKPQTLKEFESTVDTIVRARAMGNLKKWYLDLNWWKGQIF
ncbi:MAG: hypothetical protein HQ456_10530 [Polynucleobacter sp.]|jgi:hypothetical protein|nr:hypothetical protein [Polynucleobacter sp.]